MLNVSVAHVCPKCDGKRKLENGEDCPTCEGRGVVFEKNESPKVGDSFTKRNRRQSNV